MTCTQFDAWLDDGRLSDGADVARAHAASCARCASALAASLELESAFDVASALAPIHAPAALTDRVMQRIALDRALAEARTSEPMAWWAVAASEPRVALSLVAAAALSWAILGGRASVSLVLAAVSTWLRVPALPSFLAEPLAAPPVALGLGLTLAPVALWASWWLYLWAARQVARAPARAGGAATLTLH
jgi:hypothetical protein